MAALNNEKNIINFLTADQNNLSHWNTRMQSVSYMFEVIKFRKKRNRKNEQQQSFYKETPQKLSDFSHANWSSVMFDKSTNNEKLLLIWFVTYSNPGSVKGILIPNLQKYINTKNMWITRSL